MANLVINVFFLLHISVVSIDYRVTEVTEKNNNTILNLRKDSTNLNEKSKVNDDDIDVSLIDDNLNGNKKKNDKQKPTKTKQKFRNEWLQLNQLKDWLSPVKDNVYQARCMLCDQVMSSQLFLILRHSESKKHKEKKSIVDVLSKIDHYVTEEAESEKSKSLQRKVKSAQMKIAGFVARHDNAFLLVDDLVELVKEIFDDEDAKYIARNLDMKRKKATRIVTNVIGVAHQEELVEKLRSVKFSVLTDESTDVAKISVACVIVRFYDKDVGRIQSKFLTLNEVKEAPNAENLYQDLMKTFIVNAIPEDNIIGFGSDSTNVMQGNQNSLASRFKKNLPGIFILGCVCHSAHNCASHACKELPREVEQLARSIFNYFTHSSKRAREFKEYQEFAKVREHKILYLADTRWLSMRDVVDRILEQWDALRLFFIAEELIDDVLKAEQVSRRLNEPVYKLYFIFLSWILNKMVEFNAYFQSDTVVIHRVHDYVRSLYREILSTYMEGSYLKSIDLREIDPVNVTYMLPDHLVYLGANVQIYLQQILKQNIILSNDALKNFRSRCKSFLSVCKYFFFLTLLH